MSDIHFALDCECTWDALTRRLMLCDEHAEQVKARAPLGELMLTALVEQHRAIDALFAMLISRSMHGEKPFYPSESGQPWAALLLGNEAIKAAQAESESPKAQLREEEHVDP